MVEKNYMKKFEIVFLLLGLTMTSCSGSKEHGSANLPGAASTVSPGATANAPSRLCSLFTNAEIKQILGAPVGDGKVAGPMDSACQWEGNSAGDEGVYAQIQLINGTRYWEKHSGAKGYEVLPGIGKEAFVATSLGGWEAGTVNDKAVVFVSLNGGSASRDNAVKFLRSTLQKLGMNN